MPAQSVLIIGSGHLAFRIKKLATANGFAIRHVTRDALGGKHGEDSAFDGIVHGLRDIDLSTLSTVYLVDDRDEDNLELLIALVSMDRSLSIVASFFNENVAPHLRAAHPNVRILNPAKIAAPTFIQALEAPVTRTLRYVPAGIPEAQHPQRSDSLIKVLIGGFLALILVAVVFFHYAEHLSWLNSVYFVVVTVGTVGYGDITLLNAPATTKLVGIGLILASTCFIWMIFSLTVDNIIKRRVQLALGRKRYAFSGHVILCGLGRLGFFIAEGLLKQGEKLLIVEKSESSPTIEYFRSRGADVYIGDARLPRVLQDVGVARAKALYSVINSDYANLEVGLNARSFEPSLRLILRIFDESMSQRIKEHLDVHLTFSMTAIADERFFSALDDES